ncbi:MAG: dockerin type I repeat-containing protein [Clostridia bacterium]|nr:dockerin type I repeat-containing protein [Clostridia bacterium]
MPYIAYEESDILGDIDGDGEVTANDYNMARNAVLGKITLTPAQIKRGDVDGNGKINARDYLLIRRIYLGTYF